MYDDQIEEFREKIGRLENEIVALLDENVRLKEQLEAWGRGSSFTSNQKFVTSTFCGTDEQYREWLRQYGTNTT